MGDAPTEREKYPLGKNAKLDELMVLVAVSAAAESGSGYDLTVLKREAKRATELWYARPTAPGIEVREMVAELTKCRELFTEIRMDWSDPRSECREGVAIINALIERLAGIEGE